LEASKHTLVTCLATLRQESTAQHRFLLPHPSVDVRN
jgi:hypothetical protein